MEHLNRTIPVLLPVQEGRAMWSIDGDDLLFGAALLFVIAVLLAIV